MNPSTRWAVLATAGFYGCFRYNAYLYTQGAVLSPLYAGLSLFFLLLLLVSSYRQPLERWVYLLTLLIPFEASAPLGPLTSLSPIDYLCVVSLICVLAQKPLRSWGQELLMVFGKEALIFWGLFFGFAVINIALSNGSVRPLLRWTEFLYAFGLARFVSKENSHLSLRLSLVLSGLAAVLSMMALNQFITSRGDYMQTFATFKQHNGFSAFLSLCLPALWGYSTQVSSHLRFTFRLLFLIGLIAFLFSFSRGAWIGLTLGSLTVLLLRQEKLQSWTQRPRIVFMFLCGFMILATFTPLCIAHVKQKNAASFDSSHRLLNPSQRPLYWQTALSFVKQHPWRGVGPGNYEKNLPQHLSGEAKLLYTQDIQFKHRNDFWQHLHSIYLQIVVEYGVLGFILWSCALAALLTPAFVTLKNFTEFSLSNYFVISLMAFLIHNSVDVLFVSSLDLLFAFLIIASQMMPSRLLRT